MSDLCKIWHLLSPDSFKMAVPSLTTTWSVVKLHFARLLTILSALIVVGSNFLCPLNFYSMQYHGGTNFGRTAGGPFITTSYDYDAPIDEYGTNRLPLTPKHNLNNQSLVSWFQSSVFEWPQVCFDSQSTVIWLSFTKQSSNVNPPWFLRIQRLLHLEPINKPMSFLLKKELVLPSFRTSTPNPLLEWLLTTCTTICLLGPSASFLIAGTKYLTRPRYV